MDSKFMKMMAKKKEEGPMDDMHKAAKMSTLQSLRDEMSNMMKGDLHGGGMKHVEVAAPDSEGISDGLDKAKEMIGGEGEESSESPEAEASEHDPMSEHPGDEISDEEIDQLMSLLEKLKNSRT